MAHVRCLSGNPGNGTKSEWLTVIHKANEIVVNETFFGRPVWHGDWWAGGTVEEYPDARVLHRGDGSVSIVSKTVFGDFVLRRAAAALGIHVSEWD